MPIAEALLARGFIVHILKFFQWISGAFRMQQSRLTFDVIETLNLPAYPHLGDLVVAVEKKYGKSLLFEEGTVESLGEGVTGQWIDTPHHGIIRYLRGARAWSAHIVLHELSHILLGHKGRPLDGLIAGSFFSGIGKRHGVSWMCRAVDVPLDDAEAAAENLAFGLAQALHASPEKEATQAERVFGL
ncbi:hypothetical protein PY310_19100 [Pseudarthrobacter sp. H3Y2-7]|uniref:hypothetical protein n=1 Tax=Pseudarthrobacter naphthalenicus TaxID=3031328 RepID=UPI0023B155DA|nr:hypothetical protein [Pseudarthrobacter sp. H3Y2-7]MDE8670687.1 hypothetical protein [Pseudarthrobacter sp. H3Y2-7]